MASGHQANEINDDEVRAQLIAQGWCPTCTDPEGPASQEKTLVDHCLNDFSPREREKACTAAWLRCTECGSYGNAARWTGPTTKPVEDPQITIDEE